MDFDLEGVAGVSAFGGVEGLARFVAENVDLPVVVLAERCGLGVGQLRGLLVSRGFREVLSGFLLFREFSPEVELRAVRRMVREVEREDGSFGDFREAVGWVFRQGGLLREGKAVVEHGGSVRLSFALDGAGEGGGVVGGSYVAPDPFEGVVGVRGELSEVAGEGGVVEGEFVGVGGGEGGEGEG